MKYPGQCASTDGLNCSLADMCEDIDTFLRLHSSTQPGSSKMQ